MARYIIKVTDPVDNKSYYLEWSTVVDAPVTRGMSLEEFKEYYQDEYGRSGNHDLESRLERVESQGTSSMVHRKVEHIPYFNLQSVLDEFCRPGGHGT